MEARDKEITVKLKVDGITIPFPEDIEEDWMKDFVYFPDQTMDCLRECQEKYFSGTTNKSVNNHTKFGVVLII